MTISLTERAPMRTGAAETTEATTSMSMTAMVTIGSDLERAVTVGMSTLVTTSTTERAMSAHRSAAAPTFDAYMSETEEDRGDNT